MRPLKWLSPFGDSPACTVTVVSPGTLEIHNIAGTNNGTVTSSILTLTMHNTPLFGECQYSTSGTDVGILKDKLPSAPTLELAAKSKSENGRPCWGGRSR